MADEFNLQKAFDEAVSDIKAKVGEMRTANDKANNDLAMKLSEQVSKLEKEQKSIADELISVKRGVGATAVKKTSKTPYRDAFEKFIRAKSQTATVWDSDTVKILKKEDDVPAADPEPTPQTGVVGDDDPTNLYAYGGYTVPSELDRQIQRSLLDNNVVYGAVGRRTVSTPHFYMPVRVAGVATEWLGSETATITQQDAPTFKQIEPYWGNLASRADLSIQLIEDSQFDVVSYLMDEFGIAFADAIENVLTTGDGSGKPIGLLSATLAATGDKSRAVGTFEKVNTGGALSADNLITLFCKAKPGYRQNGAFMMNSTTELAVRLLKDGEDRYLWQPAISADRPSTILNRPLLINEYMGDAATTSAIPVIFGDFRRGFLVVERTGLHVKQDDITGDLVVKYKCFKRYGSMFVDSCALKYLVKTAS